jgi:hypothetical protein
VWQTCWYPKDLVCCASASQVHTSLTFGVVTTLQNKVSGETTKPAPDAIKKKTGKSIHYLLCIAKTDLSGAEEPPSSKRGIFDGLTIYVNGSTNPLISDHKLKHLLAEHGAKISIHLGRRQVTHVILGSPCGRAGGVGAGGGLAATKIQKEIKRTGGCGIRYVGVQW